MPNTNKKFYRPTIAELRKAEKDLVALIAYYDDRHGEEPQSLLSKLESLQEEIGMMEDEGEEG